MGNYEIEFLDRQHNEFSNVFARCLDTRLKTYTSWDVTAHVQGFTQKKMAWASYADAAKYMNPNGQGVEFVGKYLMTARTTDLAGVYGHNAVNNYRDIQQAILVRDNNKPVIYLAGSNPEITECRKESTARTWPARSTCPPTTCATTSLTLRPSAGLFPSPPLTATPSRTRT